MPTDSGAGRVAAAAPAAGPVDAMVLLTPPIFFPSSWEGGEGIRDLHPLGLGWATPTTVGFLAWFGSVRSRSESQIALAFLSLFFCFLSRLGILQNPAGSYEPLALQIGGMALWGLAASGPTRRLYCYKSKAAERERKKKKRGPRSPLTCDVDAARCSTALPPPPPGPSPPVSTPCMAALCVV